MSNTKLFSSQKPKPSSSSSSSSSLHKANAEEGSSFNILNYESWVSPEVLEPHSVLRQQIQLTHNSSKNEFSFFPCSKEERVCWQHKHKDENEPEFIYMYKFLFEKLSISLPFSKFQCDFLATLNVAPTQLHPQTWGYMKAFEILCSCVGIEPSVSKFLYFFSFQSCASGKAGWISARRRPGRWLVGPFDFTCRYWKNKFFRVRSSFFFDEGGNPRFPLHWTTDRVVSYHTFEIEQLNEVERDEVQQLGRLPKFHCAADLIKKFNENRHALMSHICKL